MIGRSAATASASVAALGVACALGNMGCAPAIGGSASFPVLSRTTLPNYFEPVATVDEKRCSHVVLFLFAWGDESNHEALVTDILTKHKGDAIADAELTFFSIPAIVYHQQCARVQGTVVRRTGAASPPAGRPPSVAPAKAAEGVR
jgi:hypothetical protein